MNFEHAHESGERITTWNDEKEWLARRFDAKEDPGAEPLKKVLLAKTDSVMERQGNTDS